MPVSDEQRINRLTMRDASKFLKNITGVYRGPRTIYNWCKYGRQAYSKEHVALKHEIVAGSYFTTKADIRESLEELRK